MSTLTDADYEALADFRYQIRRYLDFSERAARDQHLTPQQHQVLLAIRGLKRSRPVAIRTLAERLLLQHHSVIGLIDRLERRGLVRRERDEADRRRVALTLTRPGAVLLERLSLAHRQELAASAPALVRTLGGLVAERR